MPFALTAQWINANFHAHFGKMSTQGGIFIDFSLVCPGKGFQATFQAFKVLL